MPAINRNPGIVVRSLSYLGDFSFGQLIFHGLISVSHIQQLYNVLRTKISIDGSGGDAIATFIAVYIITSILRFYGTLIFGVSFFQWFLGLSSNAVGILGRFFSASRVAIEFFVLPLGIGLIPLLKDEPSYIERASTSLLKKGRGFRGVFGLIARPLVLIFIFLCVFAPLLRNLAVIEGVNVEFSEIPNVKIKANADFAKFRFFPSIFFNFVTFGDLDADRFIILPQFEVTKEGAKTRIRPYLGIFDTNNDSLGYLKKDRKIDWQQLALLAKRGNPFFNSSYPFLASDLENNEITEFSNQAINEIEDLMIASLELSFKNVTKHVQEHGPFLGGYVDLRQALISLLDRGAMPRADTVYLGDRKFLRFRQLFEDVSSIDKKYRETLIPLSVSKGAILKYEWDGDLNAAVARRDFSTSFFSQAKWDESISKETHLQDLSPLSLLDNLLNNSLEDKEQEKIQEYAYKWFFEKSRYALQNDKKKLSVWLSLTMNRIYLVGEGRGELEKLRKMFLMLRNSLETKDYDFFDIERLK